MRRSLVLAGLFAAISVLPRPGFAGAVIQPGAAAQPAHAPLGPAGVCTLNFVFTDSLHTYIGTSGRCTYEVGERVSFEGREFGSIVFRVFTGTNEQPQKYLGPLSQAPIDDFALIQVDQDQVPNVSPAILRRGSAPTGFTTSGETADLDSITIYGQGVGFSAAEATQQRNGFLVTDDAAGFKAELAMTLGDSGAPIVHASDGKALGVVSALGVPTSVGTTVERILELLSGAGFHVGLVTEDAMRPALSMAGLPRLIPGCGRVLDPEGCERYR